MRVVPAPRELCVALALAAAAGVPVSVHAETLQEAWQLALAHDQTLAAATRTWRRPRPTSARPMAHAGRAWMRAAAIRASTPHQRSTWRPPGGTLQSGPIFKDNQFVSGSVQMRLPLYSGGQISAGIAAARDAASGASEMERATAAALKLDVAEAYVAVLRARRALQTAASSVDSLTAHVGDVQHMVESESVPRSDLLAARVALANAEQTRLRAANAVEIAAGGL